MKPFEINHISDSKNAGIAREHDLCAYYGIERARHDSSSYAEDSDINYNNLHISVKASGFSLMSGNFCKGCKSFDEIWNLYERTVHSNAFAYVTADYSVYLMDIKAFKEFVYKFAYLERESAKNGGGLKIRCRKESKKMIDWLNAC